MNHGAGWGRRLPIELGCVILAALLMVVPTQLASAASVGMSSASPTETTSGMGSLVALPWQNTTGVAPAGQFLGAASPTQTASVVITFNVRNPGALAELVNNVSNPSSPSYAHFLTEQQFIQVFSPPQWVDTATASWLSSYGLQVTYVAPDHRSIFVTGTLGEYSSAFHISFGEYRAANGRTFYAPMTTPSVPARLSPWVESVAGLSNEKIPITDFVVRYPGFPHPQAGSQGQHTETYDPQFHQIYQLDPLYNSTGNASAGVHPSYAVGTNVAPDLWNGTPTTGGADPCTYQTSDLNTFFNTSNGYPTGLPPVQIQPHYNIPNYVGLPPNTNTCASLGNDAEVAMDFEAAASTAPGLNVSYTWVSASNNWNAFIAMLNWLTSNDEAGVKLELNAISQSWGAPEADDCLGGPCLSPTYNTDYQELEAMGVSVFASSADFDGTIGNTGTASCPTGTGDPPSLMEPGSFPYTTSVGGVAFTSSLPGTTAGDDAGAQVWNWGCVGGIGSEEWIGSQGGVSSLFPEAFYQYGYNVNASMAFGIAQYQANGGTVYSSTSARPAPDWSGPADNLAVYVEGAWQNGFGGTSDSSPATAGVVAELTAFDGHQFGLINPLLYSLANENLSGQLPGVPTLPAIEPTYQIQNWSNDATGQSGTSIANFHGGPNYNLSTGWGIPLAWNLANLAGKPWIATNPEGPASVGASYNIAANIQDYRTLRYVNVTYKAPGATTWSNASLSLSSGNANKGTWTASIPGTALTTTGTLDYCVYAIDSMEGNSWSPWNQSGWVVNGHGSGHPWTLFGCNHPFTVPVKASGASTTIPVSFIESGLPSGKSWSVTLNGVTGSSTGKNITFNVTAGSYTYQVAGPLSGGWGVRYVPSPSAGSLSVSTHTSVSVTYGTQYEVTTVASPTSGGSVSPSGANWYNASSSVQVMALAASGYVLSGWTCTPSGQCPTTAQDPFTLTVSGVTNITADFSASSTIYPVSFLESGLPSGTHWSVTLNGVTGSSTGKNITFNVTAGSYTYQVAGPLSGGWGVRYVPNPSGGTLQVTGHTTVSVTYGTQYEVTATVSPSGGGTVSPSGANWYNASSSVQVTALAASGYVLSGWTCSPASACPATAQDPFTLTVSGVTNITADFSAVSTVPVSFVETGLPAGKSWSVTLNGVTGSSTGANITFNVTAGSYTYQVQGPLSGGWGVRYVPNPSGGTLQVTGHTTVSVTYGTQYEVTTVASPTSGGSVSPSGANWYNASSSVQVTALAASGYVLSGWTCSPASACPATAQDPFTLTVSGVTNITADFVSPPTTTTYTVTITLQPDGCGGVQIGGTTYGNGSQVSLSAGSYSVGFEACPGYVLSAERGSGGVSVAGTNASGSGRSFSMTVSGDGGIEVVFEPVTAGSWISGMVNPVGAKVTVDNGTVSVTGQGGFNVTVSPGTHEVTVSESGYETETAWVSVAAGEGAHLTITLIPLPSTTPSTPGVGGVSWGLAAGLMLLLLVVGVVVGIVIGRRRRSQSRPEGGGEVPPSKPPEGEVSPPPP